MPPHSFGEDLHQIARQRDKRVRWQQQRTAALQKSLPQADLSIEEGILHLLIDTQREVHQALQRYLSSR